MNEMGTVRETEHIYRRLTDSLVLFGKEVNPQWWLAILIPVLVLGFLYVLWMYNKDRKSVRWYWALPLALLRCSVYCILAYIFLLPATQTKDRSEKKSRVVVVVDVTDSMKISDDPPGTSRTESRLKKIMDFLSDDNVQFLRKLLDKNPVYLYRFGTRLDEEPIVFEKVTTGSEATGDLKAEYRPLSHMMPDKDGSQRKIYGSIWTSEDWEGFSNKYNFKPLIVKGLTPDGMKKVQEHESYEGSKIGDIEWIKKWLDKRLEEITPPDLAEDDKLVIKSNREKIQNRLEIAMSISQGTNLPDSLLSVVNREAGNRVQGVIVFSDGRSNLGSDSAIQELKSRAARDKIPIFTIAIGEDRTNVAIRITDVQAPDQTPPNEPFKIVVEVDGEGLLGQTVPITLDLYPPQREQPYSVAGSIKFAPGEPPHGQAEFVIDPTKVPEEIKSQPTNFKELIEGEWRIEARIPRANGERIQEKEHKSEALKIKIIKKPIRVLLFGSALSRDFQFMLNQMLRDKADMSVYIQNEGGTSGRIALLDEPERLLSEFPKRLRLDDAADADPKEKWYNLAKYDAIIAFDPDWTKVSEDQLQMLQNWVEVNAGGLIYVAGPFHTKQLARAEGTERLKALLDILPVIPGDIDLARIRRSTKEPWRLTFPGVNPDSDFMKLDDDIAGNPLAGWNSYFYGKEDPGENARVVRGMFSYYPIQSIKPGATVVARFSDPDARTPDGKDAPWLVTNKTGQGVSIFIGSGEVWRLRAYKEKYFEVFWTKLARYASAGSQRKQDRRGRILMQKEFSTGTYIRVLAQLLNSELKPVSKNLEPKITIQPLELDQYQTKDKDKENAKYKKQLSLNAKTGPEEWQGYFTRQVMALPEQFPPGQWRIDVEVPDSSETLKQKFTIKQSNPELDNTRPDFATMTAVAGEVEDITRRISDKAVVEQLKQAASRGGDSSKLAFKFDNKQALEMIPDCMITDTVIQWNNGPITDEWDRGFKLPRWATEWFSKNEKEYEIGPLLLLAVALLSIEWLTRKLLRLA